MKMNPETESFQSNPITNNNIKYWDEIINYHILINFHDSHEKWE